MQDRNLFEYALIRFVPKVEREEFINVGVILFCKSKKYLGTLYQINETRLAALSPGMDKTELGEHLKSFERIAAGQKGSGPIGKLDLPSRFRWLTANRSTVVQTSKVHPGFCNDPAEKLQQLFDQLVL